MRNYHRGAIAGNKWITRDDRIQRLLREIAIGAFHIIVAHEKPAPDGPAPIRVWDIECEPHSLR